MKAKNSNVANCGQERNRTCRSYGDCRRGFPSDCPPVPIAGGILGRYRDVDRHAIDAWRGLDRLEGSPGRNCAGGCYGSVDCNLCGTEYFRLRCRRVRARSDLRCSSRGRRRLPICRDHAGGRDADSKHPGSMDDRDSSVCGNIDRNCGGADINCRVAGISARRDITRCHLRLSRINAAVSPFLPAQLIIHNRLVANHQRHGTLLASPFDSDHGSSLPMHQRPSTIHALRGHAPEGTVDFWG